MLIFSFVSYVKCHRSIVRPLATPSFQSFSTTQCLDRDVQLLHSVRVFVCVRAVLVRFTQWGDRGNWDLHKCSKTNGVCWLTGKREELRGLFDHCLFERRPCCDQLVSRPFLFSFFFSPLFCLFILVVPSLPIFLSAWWVAVCASLQLHSPRFIPSTFVIFAVFPISVI